MFIEIKTNISYVSCSVKKQVKIQKPTPSSTLAHL